MDGIRLKWQWKPQVINRETGAEAEDNLIVVSTVRVACCKSFANLASSPGSFPFSAPRGNERVGGYLQSAVSCHCHKVNSNFVINLYSSHFKVTMNKLCACLFIIIFIDVYRKSKYIFTVTNLASILVNCFYFLRKITALRPSVLNF